MRRNRMRPNPLGSTISTAMTINTLVVLLLRPAGGGILAIRDGQVRFIHLHKPLELVPAQADHGTSKPVQHVPGGLVAPQTQYALQPQGAHALFLMGQVPSCSQPTRNGVRVLSKMVPDVTVPWYWHERHIRRVRLARYTSPALPQRRQTKPLATEASQERLASLFGGKTSQEIRSRCGGSPVQELALASGFPSSYSHVTGAK